MALQELSLARVAIATFPATAFFTGRWHEHKRKWYPSEGIPGIVLETEFPYLVNDCQTHNISDPELVERYDIASCVCVPIKNAHEKVLGFFAQLHFVGNAA